MTIYINHAFHYETENLVRLFFPNDKITVCREKPDEATRPLITALIFPADNGSVSKLPEHWRSNRRF